MHLSCRSRGSRSSSPFCTTALSSETEREEHDALVTESALALARGADRLVLAQASLAHLAGPLAKATGSPVFASPEWMVRDTMRRLQTSICLRRAVDRTEAEVPVPPSQPVRCAALRLHAA